MNANIAGMTLNLFYKTRIEIDEGLVNEKDNWIYISQVDEVGTKHLITLTSKEEVDAMIEVLNYLKPQLSIDEQPTPGKLSD